MDLEDIQDHGLIEFGLAATRNHMAGFEKVFALLRRHPRAGQLREEFGQGIRAFSHAPHRILYRLQADDVLIVRVLHTAMRSRFASGKH
ncbi:toxin ParE1/3/4 [Novosphingobium chloroacetimidivorans]|uniref:Toxin ParE1/3/4 n=1 Tax=Novosphingobium chloroacetimidivorans TaxID=1428314 RepID=A0A7W7K874_9SPHN|nr:toxin ParE1/3/4 [Novosphingobium chloroacetimidivorans]